MPDVLEYQGIFQIVCFRCALQAQKAFLSFQEEIRVKGLFTENNYNKK